MKTELCSHCNGVGRINDPQSTAGSTKDCDFCLGTGFIVKPEDLPSYTLKGTIWFKGEPMEIDLRAEPIISPKDPPEVKLGQVSMKISKEVKGEALLVQEINEMLDRAEGDGVIEEVRIEAMNYARAHPECTYYEALKVGFKEWVK